MHEKNRLSTLNQKEPTETSMNTNQIPNPPVAYATQEIPLAQPPHSWIEQNLHGQAAYFTMDIDRREVMIVLPNPNILAQLVTEEMTLAMDSNMNHV